MNTPETTITEPHSPEPNPGPRKGPLSFLSGAVTAAMLCWLSLRLSQTLVVYYALHPPHYTARIAQSIAVGLKTLIVGISFLATFSFGFIGLGLSLVFVRSLVQQGSGAAVAANADGGTTTSVSDPGESA